MSATWRQSFLHIHARHEVELIILIIVGVIIGNHFGGDIGWVVFLGTIFCIEMIDRAQGL